MKRIISITVITLFFLPANFSPGKQTTVVCSSNHSIFLPIIVEAQMAKPSVNEHIEALVRKLADYPYDALIVEIFTDSVNVRQAGSRQIIRGVSVPSDINVNKLRLRMPVHLGQTQGKPYLADYFPQFDTEDIDYAGKGTAIPDPPHISVVATKDGWRVTWQPVAGANRYRVYWNDEPNETSPDEIGYTAETSIIVPYEDPYRYFAVKAVSGLSESELSAWITDTEPPPMPDTFLALNAIEGHELVITGNDVSLSGIGFKCWEIEIADDGEGENPSSLGYFYPQDFPYLNLFGPGTAKYYRIRSIDFAGNGSDWTEWDDAWVLQGDVKDLFDGYGKKDNLDISEDLRWVKISGFEEDGWINGFPPPEWNLPPQNHDSYVDDFVEGEKSYYVDESPGGSIPIYKNFNPPVDLSQNGYFTEDDYLVFAVKASGIDHVRFRFYDSNGYREAVTIYVSDSDPIHFLQLYRDGPWGIIDWSDVVRMSIIVDFTGDPDEAEAYFDDFRLAKADPDNPTDYNDTGKAWDKAVNTGSDKGVWHIYEGNRVGEPPKPFGYGQVKTTTSPSIWYMSHKPLSTTSILSGTVQAGIYLRDTDGEAGLSFFVKDVGVDNWNMYAVEADSAAGTITLVKWVNGTRAEIASTTFAFAPDQILWLGADFKEYDSDSGRIKVYASLSEGNLIQASNLRISTQDTEWVGDAGGSVGLLSYQSNVRFVNFVAGSPAHAEVADVARALDGPILAGEKKRVRYNPDDNGFEWSVDGQTWTPVVSNLVGEIKLWPTDSAPNGWLLCYGQAISRTTYSNLFGVIGTTFGNGDGSTTFNLPDLRGRTVIGQDDMGGSPANRVTAAAADSIGGSGGAETHKLEPTEMPHHTHPGSINARLDGGSAGPPYYMNFVGNGVTSYNATYSGVVLGYVGGDQPHNNMPPWLALNFIIYAGV